VEVKENIKRFFRKDLTRFFTLLPAFAASPLVNCQLFKNTLELVENMMQIMHISLIFM